MFNFRGIFWVLWDIFNSRFIFIRVAKQFFFDIRSEILFIKIKCEDKSNWYDFIIPKQVNNNKMGYSDVFAFFNIKNKWETNDFKSSFFERKSSLLNFFWKFKLEQTNNFR